MGDERNTSLVLKSNDLSWIEQHRAQMHWRENDDLRILGGLLPREGFNRHQTVPLHADMQDQEMKEEGDERNSFSVWRHPSDSILIPYSFVKQRAFCHFKQRGLHRDHY